jgi:uncharacterized protein (DUF1330 family)
MANSKGYWIFQMDVRNVEGWKAYQEAVGPVLERYGARFMVRGGRAEHVEGNAPGRTVVLEFRDYETALACWRSPDYEAAKALRVAHGSGNVTIVEGYDGA